MLIPVCIVEKLKELISVIKARKWNTLLVINYSFTCLTLQKQNFLSYKKPALVY